MLISELLQCEQCPRLVAHLHECRQQLPHYHNRPVAPIGADDARLLIVGLAPGKHGANASGQPFSGDASGDFLFAALARKGLVEATAAGEWRLAGCRITNAVKCLPPANRPSSQEIQQCNSYLRQEIAALARDGVILALGQLAHRAVVTALDLRQKSLPFQHGGSHALQSGQLLISSYHCSRYNTQTGRLTASMFDAVLDRVCKALG